MITRLKVENFTAFDSLELEFGEGIQVFVGANGTGKTHLLKIMYAMTPQYQPAGPSPVNTGKILNIFSLPNIEKLERNDAGASIIINGGGFNSELTINSNIKDFPTQELNSGNSSQENYPSNVIYIPVKDMLGTAKGFQSLYRLRHTSFDSTYDDILTRAYLPSLKEVNLNYRPLIEKIEKIIGGKVEVRGEEFYIVSDKKALEMSLVAEGWRKFALLWLLLRNGSLEKNSILFWDEPEANLNPWATPFLAEILLQLSREGVQIFLATHSYVLLQELDLQKGKHPIHYHSLYFDNGEVRVNTARDYDEIEPNLIEQENIRLYHAELGHILESDE